MTSIEILVCLVIVATVVVATVVGGLLYTVCVFRRAMETWWDNS